MRLGLTQGGLRAAAPTGQKRSPSAAAWRSRTTAVRAGVIDKRPRVLSDRAPSVRVVPLASMRSTVAERVGSPRTHGFVERFNGIPCPEHVPAGPAPRALRERWRWTDVDAWLHRYGHERPRSRLSQPRPPARGHGAALSPDPDEALPVSAGHRHSPITRSKVRGIAELRRKEFRDELVPFLVEMPESQPRIAESMHIDHALLGNHLQLSRHGISGKTRFRAHLGDPLVWIKQIIDTN